MLREIIKNKKIEVELQKEKLPLAGFKPELIKSSRDFKKAISKDKLNLIAEFKRNSPSKSIIDNDFNINKIIKIYDKSADAVSVLTDNKFFSGNTEDMNKISKLTALPILRKDFIVDEYQIYESRLHNADAILLIASILDLNEINHFIEVAGSLDMDCIVEVHNQEELDKVLRSKAKIIGINNRNLDNLEIDMDTTLILADRIPKGRIIVSESGIKSRDYIEKIKNKVNAVITDFIIPTLS